MKVILNDTTYYRTAEACKLVGITKNTYLRWVSTGVVPDVLLRDRRNWRLFSLEDVETLRKEVNRITMSSALNHEGQI